MSDSPKIRLAYLVSQYPAANHTFILREIRYLRVCDFDVRVVSISAADRPSQRMTTEECEESDATFYVKPQGVSGALRAHAGVFFAHPVAYLKGLLYALKLSGLDLSKLLPTLFYFIEAVMVGDWMRQNNLNHFHTHFSSTVGLFVRKIFPVTMSMTIHGPSEFNDTVGFRLAEKVAASSFVCAISNFCRSQIMRSCAPADWNKIELAPLGVNTEIFAPYVLKRKAHEIVDNTPFEIICVGRLAPVKAQLVLINALEILLQDGRDARLRLVGDGEDRQMLEAEVKRRGITEHVVFEGWRNQHEVLALYSRADVFALASFAEGVPVVLMEAMALGLPCVATFVNGVPELIRNETDGLLVPPSDTEALAHALKRLMDDVSLRHRLAEAGRARVVEKYNLDKNTALLAEIFRRRLAVHLADDKSLDNVDSVNQAVLMKQHANDIFNEHANELNPCNSVSAVHNSALSRNE